MQNPMQSLLLLYLVVTSVFVGLGLITLICMAIFVPYRKKPGDKSYIKHHNNRTWAARNIVLGPLWPICVLWLAYAFLRACVLEVVSAFMGRSRPMMPPPPVPAAVMPLGLSLMGFTVTKCVTRPNVLGIRGSTRKELKRWHHSSWSETHFFDR